MRYWDSSALVALLVEEEESENRRGLLREDPSVITWWASRIEGASALNRLHREGVLGSEQLQESLQSLDVFTQSWIEVQAMERVRLRALRLLHVHPLRATDALQLAACLISSDENPPVLRFVCSDGRLVAAAEKEGFTVM